MIENKHNAKVRHPRLTTKARNPTLLVRAACLLALPIQR